MKMRTHVACKRCRYIRLGWVSMSTLAQKAKHLFKVDGYEWELCDDKYALHIPIGTHAHVCCWASMNHRLGFSIVRYEANVYRDVNNDEQVLPAMEALCVMLEAAKEAEEAKAAFHLKGLIESSTNEHG